MSREASGKRELRKQFKITRLHTRNRADLSPDPIRRKLHDSPVVHCDETNVHNSKTFHRHESGAEAPRLQKSYTLTYRGASFFALRATQESEAPFRVSREASGKRELRKQLKITRLHTRNRADLSPDPIRRKLHDSPVVH